MSVDPSRAPCRFVARLFALASGVLLSIGLFAAEESKAPEGARSQAYNEKSAEVNKLEAKIRDLRMKIQASLEKKRSVRDNSQLSALLEEIKAMNSEMNEAIRSYNAASRDLKYRFPDEGLVTERRYIQLRERSIEDLEKEMELSGELRELKARVVRTYQPMTAQKDPKSQPNSRHTRPSTPQAQTPAPTDAEPRLRLER